MTRKRNATWEPGPEVNESAVRIHLISSGSTDLYWLRPRGNSWILMYEQIHIHFYITKYM